MEVRGSPAMQSRELDLELNLAAALFQKPVPENLVLRPPGSIGYPGDLLGPLAPLDRFVGYPGAASESPARSLLPPSPLLAQRFFCSFAKSQLLWAWEGRRRKVLRVWERLRSRLGTMSRRPSPNPALARGLDWW